MTNIIRKGTRSPLQPALLMSEKENAGSYEVVAFTTVSITMWGRRLFHAKLKAEPQLTPKAAAQSW